ncbi:QcrA and Rieske domain-containing protein [Limnovirga soli]|uniref:Rieske 2Fe-2S domain-containing protein n=1 Tax=Limnovirga soli TaxID=2656915 RepID=A0A8J8JTA2_9BACT|nr:Rieske 2Fe-2S domain-containing protein [Limnovirga soli]NNV55683.1 Rieske 2Fe-2S domain-containing protein [Limnovirga soli]
MDRKEFLAQVGFGAASLIVFSCLGGCSKESGTPVSSTDFTVDLNAASSAALSTPGGFIYSNGIIIAKTLTSDYIAVSQACTHEGITVTYESATNSFYCGAHGSEFCNTGAVMVGPANKNLKQFNTTLTGSSLRVYA